MKQGPEQKGSFPFYPNRTPDPRTEREIEITTPRAERAQSVRLDRYIDTRAEREREKFRYPDPRIEQQEKKRKEELKGGGYLAIDGKHYPTRDAMFEANRLYFEMKYPRRRDPAEAMTELKREWREGLERKKGPEYKSIGEGHLGLDGKYYPTLGAVIDANIQYREQLSWYGQTSPLREKERKEIKESRNP